MKLYQFVAIVMVVVLLMILSVVAECPQSYKPVELQTYFDFIQQKEKK